MGLARMILRVEVIGSCTATLSAFLGPKAARSAQVGTTGGHNHLLPVTRLPVTIAGLSRRSFAFVPMPLARVCFSHAASIIAVR